MLSKIMFAIRNWPSPQAMPPKVVWTRSGIEGGWLSENISHKKLPASAKGADSQNE